MDLFNKLSSLGLSLREGKYWKTYLKLSAASFTASLASPCFYSFLSPSGPLDVVGVYTARHTDGDVESIDVEAIETRQVRETVKLVPRSRPGRGEANGSNIPPREALLTGEKNPGKCAVVLPDFLALKARSVWMTLQTIATRQGAGLTVAAFA